MAKRKLTDDDYVARDRTDAIHRDPAYCIIIRAIHCRGDRQALALAELDRRGLWLTEEQKAQAGLAPLAYVCKSDAPDDPQAFASWFYGRHGISVEDSLKKLGELFS